jgi:hypothetical protein
MGLTFACRGPDGATAVGGVVDANSVARGVAAVGWGAASGRAGRRRGEGGKGAAGKELRFPALPAGAHPAVGEEWAVRPGWPGSCPLALSLPSVQFPRIASAGPAL